MVVIFGVKCTVIKQDGYDVYGKKRIGGIHPEKCAVVKLETSSVATTVRVDMGASRGGAEEYVADAVLLMNKHSKVALDDIIDVEGIRVRVTARRLRHSVTGRLNHYQIEGTIEQA